MLTGDAEGAAHVRFEDWTKTRVPLVIGTNSGSEPLAFQGWRNFKEAFAPELIHRAALETSEALKRPVKTCLDPCAGSGTTPLACQFLGIHPIAIEVNPFLADLIEAKLTVVNAALVAHRLGQVIGSTTDVDAASFYAAAPKSFIEPGLKERFLFNKPVADRLASLVSAVQRLPEQEIQRLFRVLLASAALEVCNATISGKGRRYRKNWTRLRQTSSDLEEAFMRTVEAAVFDIVRYGKRKSLTYDLRRGDARELIEQSPNVDLVVFSPPYPNSFDYTDVYNIELWALGYLRAKADNTRLRESTIRSHVQIKRDLTFRSGNIIVDTAVASLRAAPDLWDRSLPDMVGAYFSDLSLMLSALRKKLLPGGRIYMIVGDSRYAGVDVPVAGAVISLAPSLGFAPVGAEPFRSMRASPQQGGRRELPETLITLSAC